MISPDRWVIVRSLGEGEVVAKVFAMWSGGYLYGDSWRINSGITSIELEDDCWIFTGFSGSKYVCHKDGYGMTAYGASILSPGLEAGEHEILKDREDWTTLLQEIGA